MSEKGPRYYLDAFLPERLRRRPESRRRARVIVGLALGMIVLSTLSLIARLSIGEASDGLLISLPALAAILAAPVILAKTGRMDIAGLLLTLSWLFGLVIGAYYEGGIRSPVIFVLPLPPLVAFFAGGWKFGLGAAVFAVTVALGFPLLPWLGVPLPPTPLSEIEETHLRGITLAIATATATVFAWLYDRERTEAEFWLDSSRQAAEHASEVKSRFLANMSHEIRTPMTGILGNADLLLEMNLTPEATDHARIIALSVENLSRVLDDILDFSKMEADKLNLEITHFPLRETVEETLRLLAPMAAAKGINLRHKIEESLPNPRQGDPVRLRQILINLLGNAIKFTTEGHAELHVETVANQPNRVRFMISDSGIGIPDEVRGNLFLPFQQADDSMSRRFGGTGLGLAISSRLVRMMGGTISVESTPGEGSTFTVLIRLKVVTEPKVAEGNVAALPRASGEVHILLAEDDPTNRLIATRHLEVLGYTVDAVTNGREVLDLLFSESNDSESLAKPRYAAILMDCQMPELDGFETCRQLRQRYDHPLPVIAFTAHAMADEHKKCLDAGMDDFITKPFRQADLARVLARWCTSS